jgi:hypothetical protein
MHRASRNDEMPSTGFQFAWSEGTTDSETFGYNTPFELLPKVEL